MMPQRQSQIAAIARAALSREEAKRETFLREACGTDRALRSDVDALLTVYATDPSERLTASVDASAGQPPHTPPDISHIEDVLSAAGRSGHYRIESRVGAGGMGVVYKATDLRLNRAVAIKAILGGRELDTGRLRKEALAAASLDHPYICKVYELIEAETEQLIVMEFVEGETLARRLKRGIPPFTVTLQLAIEIAEGLANAHARGLVHRDLKPGNVMVTSHGHIKLLDFGLARQDAAGAADDTETATQRTDARGGTPHYMAPEQAEGRPVTARADVFAFGVVLFESVTGRLPFESESGHDYVDRLRFGAPTPVRTLAPDLPAGLAALIDRCLDKAPANRPESARQVVEELRREAGGSSPSTDTGATALPPGARRSWLVPAMATALAITGLFAWRAFSVRIDDAPVRRSRPFVTSSSEESHSRISPDGQWISYVSTVAGDTQVLVQRVGGGDAQRVALPGGGVMDQVWSPDGTQLACVLRQGQKVTVQVVPALSGAGPVYAVSFPTPPLSARLLRWIAGAIYLETIDRTGQALARVDLASGSVVDLSRDWPVTGKLRGFDVSPDGTRVVYTLSASGQEDLWVANLNGTSAKQLTNDPSFERFPVWSGAGTTVIYQSNRGGPIDLWETSIESGRSWPLTSSPDAEEPESTSSDGRLVSFRQVSEDADLWTWDLSRSAGLQLTADALSDFSPTAAANGAAVVFQRRLPTPLLADTTDSTLFVGSLQGGRFQAAPRALTNGFAPQLSSDGLWVAYLTRGPGAGATLFVKQLPTNVTMLLSSACPRPVYSMFPMESADQNMAWTASAAELYFVDGINGASVRRFRIGAAEAEPPLARAAPNTSIHGLRLSPDGRQLVYLESSSSTSTVHVFDVATGTGRSIAELQGSVYVRGWLRENAGVVLVRAKGFHEDFTADLEILVVSPAGTLRQIGAVDRALIATARLDPARAVLYVTRSEAGTHNLYAFPLATALLRRITENTLPGVTFSGVEPLDGSTIMGVRNERKSDIWLLDASPR